jgi:pilus assembly protein CpaB
MIVAILIAGVAVFGVVSYISNIRLAAEKEVEKIEVLVAVNNIPKDAFVSELLISKSVELQAIPRKYIADNVLTTLDNYKEYVTISPISKGEQITSTKFVKPEQVGMAFNIPADMVAISIPVDEVVGVSNLISIGDMVNVIATFKPEKEEEEAATGTTAETAETAAAQAVEPEEELVSEIKEPITKTLLWNVQVLFIGTREITIEEQKPTEEKILSTQTEKEKTTIKVRTVTLALTPEDSEKLVFSEEMGLVWLALVPSEGVAVKDTAGRTYINIFED